MDLVVNVKHEPRVVTVYHEGITSSKREEAQSKDKFCETTVAWKQNHFLYAHKEANCPLW